jgi:hypothetical protein
MDGEVEGRQVLKNSFDVFPVDIEGIEVAAILSPGVRRSALSAFHLCSRRRWLRWL